MRRFDSIALVVGLVAVGLWYWFVYRGEALKAKLSPEVNAAIDKYAAQYGVDPALARAQAIAESQGQQYDKNGNVLKSGAGALGVFQLMPATAKGLGVDPTKLDDNIRGGIMYLSQMLKKFGRVDLALAAYNAGPGNVNKYGGIPPFAETKAYVKKILGMVGL